jgi:hypothetical protein
MKASVGGKSSRALRQVREHTQQFLGFQCIARHAEYGGGLRSAQSTSRDRETLRSARQAQR